MRRSSLLVLALGVVLLGGGLFFGCGAFFAWNGRHAVAVEALELGTAKERVIPIVAGRRYTLAVEVVFDRAGLVERDGGLIVEAKLPLNARIGTATGETTASVIGWVDPDEATTTLFGRTANAESERRPMGAPPRELVAQRLVEPFTAPADGEARFFVELGPDRVGKARVTQARVTVYDDAVPYAVTVPLGAAAVGGLLTLAGGAAVALGVMRRRRRRTKG